MPVLLLFMLGCSRGDVTTWKHKTDADVVTFVRRYREAKLEDVEAVLRNYLAMADEYERREWRRYGAPGWIDELRSACEPDSQYSTRLRETAMSIGSTCAARLRTVSAHTRIVITPKTMSASSSSGWIQRKSSRAG